MTIFGQFGLRPSQTKHKCLAYFLDIWFLCSYTSMCAGILWILGVLVIPFPSNLSQIRYLYSSVFMIIIFIPFTMWLVLTFKKYNIFCLLEDVVSIRRATLSKTDIFCVTATITVVAAVFITYEVLNTILPIQLNMSLLNILSVILKSVFLYTAWMLMCNITFLLCVIALIISREFQKCVSDMKNTIIEDGTLFSDVFFEIEERFRLLTSIVNKVDSMFCVAVGIILTMTFSTLCGAMYSVVIGDKNPTIWYMSAVYSAVSLGFLLLSLSTLNHRVRTFL